MRKRLEHLPSTFSDFIIVNGLISTAAVIVTHSMYKVCLYVFSPKCALQSPSVCLEFLRNDTGFPLTRSDLWSIEASLFLPLSFSDLSQSLLHSLPLLVTPVQGGSVCGTEEADPRKGAALHTDSIQLHSTPLSLPGRDARDAGALEALKMHFISKRPQNQLWAQC